MPKWREAVALLAVGCLVLGAVRIGLATAHHIRSRVRRGRQTGQVRLLGPLTTSRLDQLAMTPGNSNALWRAARCAATAVAVLALPAATGTVLVGAISCVVG